MAIQKQSKLQYRCMHGPMGPCNAAFAQQYYMKIYNSRRRYHIQGTVRLESYLKCRGGVLDASPQSPLEWTKLLARVDDFLCPHTDVIDLVRWSQFQLDWQFMNLDWNSHHWRWPLFRKLSQLGSLGGGRCCCFTEWVRCVTYVISIWERLKMLIKL